MKTKTTLRAAAIGFALVLNSFFVQGQTTQWTNHYQTTGNYDWSNDVHIGGDGRIYTCGTKGGASSNDDALFISYTAGGTQNWTATYAGTSGLSDEFNSIASYGSGSTIELYAAGSAYMTGAGQDMLLVKYNQSGTQQWAATWNNSSQDIANCVQVDGSGNVYVCGKTATNGGDLFCRKYNSSGTLQWSTTYNSSGTQDDAPQHMRINGTVLYITSVRTISSTDHNAVLQQLNASTGAINWTSVYDNTLTSDIDETYWIDLDNLGYIYTAGETQTASNGLDALILKYDNTGSLISTYTWNNSTYNLDDAFSCIHIIYPTHTSQIYVTGYTQINTASNDADFLTIKYYNSSTTPVWTSTYDGTGTGCPQANDDYAYMVIAEPTSSNVVVTGRSYETSSSLNWTTIRYNSITGAQAWIDSYDRNSTDNTPANKYPLAVQYDGCSGNVDIYVTGYTKESNITMVWDATTRRYGYTGPCMRTASLNENNTDNNAENVAIKIYPNPVNSLATIEFPFDDIDNASFVVYDVAGREVKRTNDITTRTVDMNSSELKTGIYFYKLIDQNKVISSGKFIKE